MTLRTSKLCAWGAFIIVMVVMVLSFPVRKVWWAFTDIFFAFMMVFFHLIAVYFHKLPGISKQLDVAALVCGLLMVVALVVEYFLL